MPTGLKRYQAEGHHHFLTFSCFHRQPYFTTPASRDLFERSLEHTRRKYKFDIIAYVVMPEHIHLLVSEPRDGPTPSPLAKAIQALKLSVSKQSTQRPFWQTRYYDFNVFTPKKFVEKRKYIHRNPVVRGLVEHAEDWPHSSYNAYLTGQQRSVCIDI